jgi:deoxyribodipyrimidine photo-lyase
VYSPFKRSWYKAYREQSDRVKPIGKPKKQKSMVGLSDSVPSEVEGFAFESTDANHWDAGEQVAKKMLKSFLRDHGDAYKEERDLPAIEGTSKLSPYLVSGVISLRMCVHAAVEANNGELEKGSNGIVHWISELIWREFYKHILIGFPRVSMHRPFQLETERIEWKENDEHFQAWCEGRTGYPIVDAAMRQLVQTGWMHNRLRMIVAMFLTKNLFLDWRLGERFFMRHLIDGDLSANNGGWQWSASTGTDAAPYFRIFNPYSQSKKCDPDGEFIRRYVPELAGVEGSAVHEPQTIPGLLRSSIEYPDPIVYHSTTRNEAIEAFKAIRDS